MSEAKKNIMTNTASVNDYFVVCVGYAKMIIKKILKR